MIFHFYHFLHFAIIFFNLNDLSNFLFHLTFYYIKIVFFTIYFGNLIQKKEEQINFKLTFNFKSCQDFPIPFD
jgi:hypothetical protein